MSIDKETTADIVQYRVEKALATWDDALFGMQGKRFSVAANRMYYALFHAASALLIAKGIPANTNRGVLGADKFAPREKRGDRSRGGKAY